VLTPNFPLSLRLGQILNLFRRSVDTALLSFFSTGVRTAPTFRAVTSEAASCTGTLCQGCRLSSSCCQMPFHLNHVLLLPQVMQDFDLLRGSPWHTWTCTHGWAVTGLVPKVAGGTPVHAVSRSHRGDIIAVADDFGLVCCYLLSLFTRSESPNIMAPAGQALPLSVCVAGQQMQALRRPLQQNFEHPIHV
jgi:hypothetical protein